MSLLIFAMIAGEELLVFFNISFHVRRYLQMPLWLKSEGGYCRKQVIASWYLVLNVEPAVPML